MRRTDEAWAAGLFEGEGSFRLARKRHSNGEWTYAHATLVSTDPDIIQRFAAIVGVGHIYEQEPRNPRHKLQYIWAASSRADFARVVRIVKPYLGIRRTERLAEIEAGTSPIRRQRQPKRFCKRGHELSGRNAKPNGVSSTGRPKVTCRVCVNAR